MVITDPVGTLRDVLLVSPLGLPLRERMATEKLEMHVLREAFSPTRERWDSTLPLSTR
jgi:hypothetical protein